MAKIGARTGVPTQSEDVDARVTPGSTSGGGHDGWSSPESFVGDNTLSFLFSSCSGLTRASMEAAVAPRVVNGVDMAGRDAKKNDASGSPYEVQASFERVRR